MPDEKLEATGDTMLKSSRDRRLRRIGIILLISVVVLALLIYVAPGFVGRYLLSSELDKLGIRHQGIETVRVDLPNGRVWFGPVSLVGAGGQPATIGEFSVDIDLAALWQRKVVIERLLLRGISLQIEQGEQGLIANGIPLEQFLAAAADEPDAVAAADDEPWEAGMEALELHDSTLHFKGRHGVLDVAVQQLRLAGFRTWEPDLAGRFELQGDINDMQLDWSGEVRPFSEPVRLDIHSRIKGAALSKVSRFIGPLGLERSDGNYDTDLHCQVRLFENGRVEGEVKGQVEIADANYLKQDQFSLAIDRGHLDVDNTFALGENDALRLTGRLGAELGNTQLSISGQTDIAMAKSLLVFDRLDLAFDAGQRLALSMDPDIDLQAFRFQGEVDISVDALLDVLAQLQALSGAKVSHANTGLGDLSGGRVTASGSDVAIGRVLLNGKNLDLKSHAGQVELDIASTTALSEVKMAVLDGTLSIKRVESQLDSFRARSGEGRLELLTKGKNRLLEASAEGVNGRLRVDAIETELGELELHTRSGGVRVALSGNAGVKGVQGTANPVEEVPEASLQLGSLQASLANASAEVDGEQLEWGVDAAATLKGLGAEFAGGERSSFELGELRVDGFHANQDLLIEADTATVDGLDVTVLRSLLEALGGAVENKAADVQQQADVSPQGAEPEGSQAEDAEPEDAGPQDAPADVRRIQELLTGLGYQPGPVDGLMGKRTGDAIKAFQRDAGLEVDGNVSRTLQSALLKRSEPRQEPAVRTVDTSSTSSTSGRSNTPRVRIGRLVLSAGSAIRFSDDLVEPRVNVDTVFKRLEATDVDTLSADRPTQADLVATINEFTQLVLKGRFQGLNEQSDFDLDLQLTDLELSNYSPYVHQLAGVYLEAGQLDTEVQGKADKGELQGEVTLGVDHLAFRPLDEKDAQQAEGKVGVPLETAVSLLQDDDGHIDLALPVSGTVAKPDVDISSAVNKAIGGALKRVFPPTLVGSLLSNVGKEGDPGFAPVEFAPGSAEMSDDAGSYVGDIAEFLTEHPKLVLKVCGRSTAKDRPEGAKKSTNQLLHELAVARARAVRAYLVREKGIDTKQVPECRSTFDPKEEAAPRVEINF